MSLLISLSEQLDNDEDPDINLQQLKNSFFSTGIFDTNSVDLKSPSHLQLHKILDLTKNYQLILKIRLQKDFLQFRTALIKNTSKVILQDKKEKLIFTRFIPKYFSKKQFIILISNSGQIITKKTIKLHQESQQKSTLLKKDSDFGWLGIGLHDFVKDSVQFYKSMIIRLEQSISQINTLKPKYCQNMLKVWNLCNYSYEPTFETYKKNPSSCKFYNNFNLNENSQNIIVNESKIQNQLFLYAQSSIRKSVEEKKNKQNSSIGLNFNLKNIYSQLQLFEDSIETQDFKGNFENQETNLNEMYKKIFISNLEINFAKKESCIKDIIYNEINIQDKEKIIWQNFQMTSFSNLKLSKIKYYNKTIFQKQIQCANRGYRKHTIQAEPQICYSTMILKHNTLKNIQKSQQHQNYGYIKWEKTIIQHCFKNELCGYIPKFFFSQQNLSSSLHSNTNLDYIMSQYMKKGTLRSWMNESGQSTSICTKINLILYILYSLTFIHSKKIFHMDLKPNNILIDKNLVPKITDFGSAYNKQVYQMMKKQKNNYFLSFSIPYTAPQIFMKTKKPQLNSKCDIFSIGLIIYEILYNQSIFKQSNQKVEQTYNFIGEILQNQNLNSKIKNQDEEFGNFSKNEHLLRKVFFCPQNMDQKSHIYQNLLNLIFRCLSCYQQRRPFLGSLIIAIKEIYQSFLQFYTW